MLHNYSFNHRETYLCVYLILRLYDSYAIIIKQSLDGNVNNTYDSNNTNVNNSNSSNNKINNNTCSYSNNDYNNDNSNDKNINSKIDNSENNVKTLYFSAIHR